MRDVPFSVFVMEMNIADFEAMPKLDMDEEKRSVVEQLLDKGKQDLARRRDQKTAVA